MNGNPTMIVNRHMRISIGTLLLMAFADSTFACSCARLSPAQLLEAYPMIFRGKVESVERGTASFSVITVYKGEMAGKTITISYNSGPGASCGTSFKEGVIETVFASAKGNSEPAFIAGMCSMIPYRSSPMTYQPALDAYRFEVQAARANAQRDPKNARGWEALLSTQEKTKDWLPALRTLDQLSAIDPRQANYPSRKGDILLTLSKPEAALEAFQTALKIDADNQNAGRGREQALIKLGRTGDLDPSRRDYAALDLIKIDFGNREIRGGKFAKARLSQSRFDGANLAQADFSEANLHTVSFRGADLSSARFDGMRSYQTDFSKANLSGASFVKANLFYGKLDEADLSGANLSGAQLEKASLARAKLANVTWKGARLFHTDLSFTDLTGRDLRGIEMQGVNLRGANLAGADLEGALLAGPLGSARGNEALHGPGRSADLRAANLNGANLKDADIRYAFFDCKTRWPAGFDPTALPLIPVTSAECPGPPLKTRLFTKPGELREMPGRIGGERAKVRGAEIDKMDLSGIDLSGANLSGFRFTITSLKLAKLVGTDLRNADLSGSVFQGANLSNADLSGATLSGADFDGATLTGTNLTGARYSERTKWPSGYNPDNAGAIRGQ